MEVWIGAMQPSPVFNNYSTTPNGLRVNSPRGLRPNGLLLRGHEGERNNCFSKIQLVSQKISSQNNFSWLTLDFNLFWPRKSRPFSLLVGYNIEPRSSSTNQNAALMIDN